MPFEVWHYLTAAGVDVFLEWFTALADRQAQARVRARIDRIRRGVFGDCAPVGEGVWELRIDWGPGYRVYYTRSGERIVLLLCGGDKRKQQPDIKRAKEYWHDYQERTKPKEKRSG
ncbi:MAG: addiction module protein [Betaproteobacteria bacterium RIFCSPHIGHO2_12_FULL_69_13]|nr:MAG: addiction module protein [Betaproteobacteria bacterium RIFCSPHIGHO2_12_FULL_69_13]OGA69712.1 MAG: addiction module protein [Betaproteobacteria bacterium RIFCSPLOWO2_12_FULL_68_20]